MAEPAETLALIAETLRAEVIPALKGAPAYRGRIAASLLDTIAREFAAGAVADDPALAVALRDGRVAIDDPDAAARLWRVALARHAIDQPRYDIDTPRA